MKKTLLLFLFLAVLLASCASPEPVNEPMVVVSVASATPVPTLVVVEGPTEASLSVSYTYVGIPEILLSERVEMETIHFSNVDGNWEKKPILTDIANKWPLFSFGVAEKSLFGSSGVNVYYEGGPVLLMPLSLDWENSVSYEVFLSGCEQGSDNPLICRKQGTDGYLNFSLDLENNLFQYSYSGTWDFRYNQWIEETLTELGYESVSESLKLETVPGGRYTIELKR